MGSLRRMARAAVSAAIGAASWEVANLGSRAGTELASEHPGAAPSTPGLEASRDPLPLLLPGLGTWGLRALGIRYWGL